MAKSTDNKTSKRGRNLQMFKGFAIALMIFTSTFVFADKTVKTIEYPLDHIAQPNANQNYLKTINVVLPDGVDTIYSVEFFLQGDYQANTDVKFKVRVNGNLYECQPTTWTTPNINTPNYHLSFDCTDLVQQYNWKGGQIEAGFRLNKVAQNVKARMKVTYKNNPKSSVASIGGTEYSAEEESKIILHILDSEGTPLNNEVCFVTVRDSHNILKVENQTLTYISGSNGLYQYVFDLSLPVGVYSVDSYCDFNGTKVYTADTFHIAQWTEDISHIKGTTYRSHDGFDELTVRRVSGTEYSLNETATLSVQTLRNGFPVFDPYCRVSIFQPDDNLVLHKVVDEANMTILPDSNGITYYNYTNTTQTGLYIADVVCEELRTGIIPSGHVNNVTDTTSSSTLGDISGSSVQVNLTQTADVITFMAIEGLTDSNANGMFALNFDNSDNSFSIRSFSSTKEGNTLVMDYQSNVSSGIHTVKGRHNISTGTLTSKVNLVSIGLEDGFGKFISCYDTIVSDTTTSATMEDMDGLSCDIVLPYDSEIFVAMVFDAQIDNPNHDILYTISIDDNDYETYERFFSSSGSYGSMNIITMSNAELQAGRHTIHGRWKVDLAGIQATLKDAKLVVFANDISTREFELQKSYVSDSTSANSPEDVDDSSVRMDVSTDNSKIIGFFSINPEVSSSNERGYFLSNINGTNGETFRRFFSSGNKRGSVGMVKTTSPLPIGDYIIKTRWYASAGATLSGDVILVGMGLSTRPVTQASYTALDFHVSDWATKIMNGTLNVSGGNISHVETVGNANVSFEELHYAGGTEYLTGTTGSVAYQWIRIQQGSPSPVDGATCNTTIWFPNETVFVENASMTHVTNSFGLYTYDFTVPDSPVSGVYRTHAICYDAPKYTYSASTFHVEDSLYNNQQTMYNFLQAMNTTLTAGQEVIKGKIDDIIDNWVEWWDTAMANIFS